MLSVGFLNGEQLVFDVVLLNEARVLLLADFAIKLLKVILDCTTNYFFFHL